ncbi:MAG: TlpA family protein disulfide reductase [Planctomycetaceae bacterium]|nr:TlpA family protein disulfide reductase [Planctomycetaceae bacterium]
MLSIRLAFVCLLSLFLAASVSAQAPSLNDARTFAEVREYIAYAESGVDMYSRRMNGTAREGELLIADIHIRAGLKMLELAEDYREKNQAITTALAAIERIRNSDDAKQKLKTFLDEFALIESQASAWHLHLTYLTRKVIEWRPELLSPHVSPISEIEKVEQEIEAFLGELAALGEAERGEGGDRILLSGRFFLSAKRLERAEPSPEEFARFTSDLKTVIDQRAISLHEVKLQGFPVAKRNGVSTEQLIEELVAHLRSSESTYPEEHKERLAVALESLVRLNIGNDLKLYGKTLDGEDFDWESLRGKYVLVKFTATWCVPCHTKLPGMLDAYEKYHDKGFEVISVYISEREEDPIEPVRRHVEENNLPWIIISEALTEQSGQPEQGQFYGIRTFGTQILVDTEGKIVWNHESGGWYIHYLPTEMTGLRR